MSNHLIKHLKIQIMKKNISYLMIAVSSVVLFLSCCKDKDEEETTPTNVEFETWQCIGKAFEYIGDGTDTLSDPVGNPAYRMTADYLFTITVNVFSDRKILYSTVENPNLYTLYFRDGMWYSYDFPTTYGYPVFVLNGFGSDSSTIGPLNPNCLLNVLKHTSDTLSLFYNNGGGTPFDKDAPVSYYSFTKQR
jgi:hypothetical protein